jgi:hypothetical protein
MKQVLTFIALALLGSIGLTACGELDQSVSYKDGKFRGKHDNPPWDSQAPSYTTGEWTKGDQYSWDRQMKARSEGQNENTRISH